VSSNPGAKAPAPRPRTALTVDEYVGGVLAGDRARLARAITLIESDSPMHEPQAQEVLRRLLPHTGKARRVGITGVPGVGKSTFIEAFGMYLVGSGHRLAVLAIDPTSTRSGGSILGDKTRMEQLANDDRAFIRPSPSGGSLGGVTRKTRETMLLCEAAGYRNVLIETVGVGQSETAVRSMVDFFLLLMLSGAGDELQGMKRGIMEMTDVVAINKADGDNKRRAEAARREYANALHLFAASPTGWSPQVVTCSAQTRDGIAALWDLVLEHDTLLRSNGWFERLRRRQVKSWMKEMIDWGLRDRFRHHPEVENKLPELERDVVEGRVSPFRAAQRLLDIYHKG